MLLFSESFHYTDAQESLKKATSFSSKYILIFDYFRKSDSQNGQRISYDQFKHLLSHTSSFKVLHDEDVTEKIAPTFFVIDEISNLYVKPFVGQVIDGYKKSNPFYSFILSKIVNRMQKYSSKPSARYSSFTENSEYRLILHTLNAHLQMRPLSYPTT
jgi:hypothetical protein